MLSWSCTQAWQKRDRGLRTQKRSCNCLIRRLKTWLQWAWHFHQRWVHPLQPTYQEHSRGSRKTRWSHHARGSLCCCRIATHQSLPHGPGSLCRPALHCQALLGSPAKRARMLVDMAHNLNLLPFKEDLPPEAPPLPQIVHNREFFFFLQYYFIIYKVG